jgi:superoxide dismutase
VSKIDHTEARGELLFFLMAICHQPYSEIQKIPEEDTDLLQQAFNRWIERIFGSAKNPKEKLKKIALGIDAKAFEDMWRPKEDQE